MYAVVECDSSNEFNQNTSINNIAYFWLHRDTLRQKQERLTLLMTENSTLLYTKSHQSRMRLSLVLRSLIQCCIKLIDTTESEL